MTPFSKTAKNKYSNIWRGESAALRLIRVMPYKDLVGETSGWNVVIHFTGWIGGVIAEFNTRDKAVAFAQKLVDLLNEEEDLK